MRGLFVTFEGGEGVGKSTQVACAADRLAADGHDALTVREPGGTPMGDRVRDLLLTPGNGMDPTCELLLYEASRAELVRTVIAPALERGAVVVCDRFTDSSLAYQGYGRGLDLGAVRAANSVATGGIAPDVTILLVGDVGAGLERATHAGADRIEGESTVFHAKVATGFAAIAAEEPGRVRTVDASGAIDEVAARVWEALTTHPAWVRWRAAERA